MHGRDRIALICCAATLGFCALAFGGAVRWAAIASTIGCLVTAAVYISSRRFETKRSPLLVLIGIAVGLTAVQLVPLPVPLAREVIAAKLELVAANAQAWGDPAPKAVMASYDPPATLVELAKLCGYAALAFAACRISTQRRGRRALAVIVVGTAMLVATVALGHAAFGAREIYGLFSSPAEPRLLSPIINDNHLASLMAMAVPIALGLGLTSAGLQRTAWLVSALVCAGLTLVTASRGGALGLLTGVVVTVALLLAQRRTSSGERPRRSVGREAIARFVIGGCVVLLVGLLTASQVFGELASTRMDEVRDSHSKFQVWVHAVDMLEDNHWLGIGRGAFEPAYTRWSEVGDSAYSHAENSYLQAAFDWGVPGALAIAFAAAIAVYAAARRWRQSPLEAGALGALASVAVHDLADFSLELPVVAMMVIVVFAILLPARVSSTDTENGRLQPIETRTRWLRSGLLVAAMVACALAASPLGQFARAEAATIGADPVVALERATIASARHPADYLLLGRAAQVLMELRDPRAAPVVMRALSVNPNHAGLHHLAAQLLVRSQHARQAKVEFALALRFATPEFVNQILDELDATFSGPDDAAEALPLDLAFAPRIVDALRGRRDGLELAYATRLALFNPDNPVTELMVAQAANRAARGDLAQPAAQMAYNQRPDAVSAIAFAQASALGGDPKGGIETLRQELASNHTRTPPEHVALLAAVADLELAAGNLEALARTLDELGAAVPDDVGRIDVHRRRVELDMRRGNTNQAAWERAQIEAIESRRGP